ncbi:MAG: IPT/TIG domain-containing protein [Nitrospiraceae bacterium]
MHAILAVFIGFVLSLAGSPVVAVVNQAKLVPDSGLPGATVSITGKGFGAFKSTRANQVKFHGLNALVQRWEPDLIEVRVPSQVENGPVEVIIGKKKVPAGQFSVLRPTIESIAPSDPIPGSTLQIVGQHFGNTAGPRDPNTLFGVNDVLVGGISVRAKKWRDDKIEIDLPANIQSGDVIVRFASSDPQPDGSCCAPVRYTVSNSKPVTVLPTIRVDPDNGPVGTKVVLFGQNFGATKTSDDALLIGGHRASIAQWSDSMIVAHVPLDAETGAVILKHHGQERSLGTFTVYTPKATGVTPASAPIGSLLKISGEHFGFYSESGATPFNYIDFAKTDNRVLIGGVPAIIYRWHDDRIDVWVPFSVTSGPVIVERAAGKPKEDGSCCEERGILTTEAGSFTVVVPRIESYTPTSAGLDDIVTIKGSGFGSFLKTREEAQLGLREDIFKRGDQELQENVSRTEVLFNGIAAVVTSWSDSEITVRVPRRHIFGVGRKHEFTADAGTGPLVVRRGSWDLLPDGKCCTQKKWLTLEAGSFTIEAKGLPDQGFFNDTRPEASTTP